MPDEDAEIVDYLARNPRMVGLLFVLLLVVGETGMVAGAVGGTTPGP